MKMSEDTPPDFSDIVPKKKKKKRSEDGIITFGYNEIEWIETIKSPVLKLLSYFFATIS